MPFQLCLDYSHTDGKDPDHILKLIDGQFELAGMPDGDYTLLVRLIGYDVYARESIRLQASDPVLDLGVIELRPLEVTLSVSYTFNNYKRSSKSTRDNRDLFVVTNH